MLLIGITGGVGAGKSDILAYLAKLPRTAVLRADDLAKELMLPGGAVHERLKEAFAAEDIFDGDGALRTDTMTRVIFSDEAKRQRANGIIHPTVREEILSRVAAARESGGVELFFLEAALLLEEHYDAVCDEIWYIYASEATRRRRLKESRGYSDAKIDAILASQLNEEDFRERCQRIIDNDGKRRTAREQVSDCVRRARRSKGRK